MTGGASLHANCATGGVVTRSELARFSEFMVTPMANIRRDDPGDETEHAATSPERAEIWSISGALDDGDGELVHDCEDAAEVGDYLRKVEAVLGRAVQVSYRDGAGRSVGPVLGVAALGWVLTGLIGLELSESSTDRSGADEVEAIRGHALAQIAWHTGRAASATA